MAKTQAMSPMMTQYCQIKEENRDCIVFYRLGDFYEMFFEDAELASRELDLTLTARDCGQDKRAPMCGVPYHSSEAYINRLIAKGYKVAICEQTEDPAQAKGLVRREIVRVITPGTVIDTKFLDETKNNYIAGMYFADDAAAVVFADISTGDVYATEISSAIEQNVVNEIGKFAPAELVYSGKLPDKVLRFARERLLCAITERPAQDFDCEACRGVVQNQFHASSLAELGLSENGPGVRALGGLFSYLYQTQFSRMEHCNKLSVYTNTRFMELDLTARRNLELCETMRDRKKHGSLLGVMDRTRTSMGGRLLRSWIEQPLVNQAEINRRLSAVQALKENYAARVQLTEQLDGIYDIERLMTKVVYNTAGGKDLLALAGTLRNIPGIKASLQPLESEYLRALNGALDPLDALSGHILSAISENCPFSVRELGLIRDGYHEEVDRLRSLLNDTRSVIAEMERKERDATGIKNLKIGYNKVFGYYIEVTKSNIGMAPERYIRKQTLANCERYVTAELKELEDQIMSASEKLSRLEYELFCEVRERVTESLGSIQRNATALAQADVLCSFAALAEKNNYVMPVVTYSDAIRITGGRHPVVETMLQGGLFVPNDTYLDNRGDRLLIITGPNMAGKSTYMRQVALIVLMAQIGSFVPAQSAEIGIVDKIFTRVGASDDLASGQSTFMLEMTEVAHILKNATEKSLVIYDEIGRGTSTFDGMSIARAVLEYTADSASLGAKSLFATHYHELTSLEGEIEGVKNYQIAVKKRGDDIVFLRKIIRGGADDSYGIEVAKLAGIPDAVIANAKKILGSLALHTGGTKGIRGTARQFDLEFEQMSLAGNLPNELYQELKDIDVDVLTPIEGLNKLHQLVHKAKQ